MQHLWRAETSGLKCWLCANLGDFWPFWVEIYGWILSVVQMSKSLMSLSGRLCCVRLRPNDFSLHVCSSEMMISTH